VAPWRDLPAEKERLPGTNLSFYNGLSGVGFVLTETWKATGATKYRQAALSATQLLADAAKPSGKGVAWSGSPGIIGDGSIILYLLYAASAFDQDAYRALAARGGDHLLELAVPQAAGGVSWKGPDFAKLSAADRRAILEILLATKPGLPKEWIDYAKSHHIQGKHTHPGRQV
jgi:hypothetical protein